MEECSRNEKTSQRVGLWQWGEEGPPLGKKRQMGGLRAKKPGTQGRTKVKGENARWEAWAGKPGQEKTTGRSQRGKKKSISKEVAEHEEKATCGGGRHKFPLKRRKNGQSRKNGARKGGGGGGDMEKQRAPNHHSILWKQNVGGRPSRGGGRAPIGSSLRRLRSKKSKMKFCATDF